MSLFLHSSQAGVILLVINSLIQFGSQVANKASDPPSGWIAQIVYFFSYVSSAHCYLCLTKHYVSIYLNNVDTYFLLEWVLTIMNKVLLNLGEKQLIY